ncbi:hypothetical protein ABH931_005712 [Streptacidiphilus sp. MAP12-33]|uniref:hypothetical protein n=1 Tax=Streptacidiphilus sp. MAP12-33 TaxID=3156266 RepID=UPI00351905CF
MSDEPGGFRAFVDYFADGMGGALNRMRDEDSDRCPYPIFPEAGGLLEWGSNYNGDTCFWLTQGSNPDSWSTIVWLRGRNFDDPWRRYDVGVVEFLNMVIHGDDPVLNGLIYPREGPVWIPAP